jgi:16S rRNA (guanine527-N7)-methyltransferase
VFCELIAGCSALTHEQASALEAHYELMLRWNKALNLTTVLKLEEAVERHYCESLFLARHLTPGTVADIGSGPGFPGFVVAVARPDCQVTLIEAHQRKAVFLREASRKLPNLRVLAKRAEEVRESFDWAISRAVSYDDLGKSILRLGKRIALLSGAEEPPTAWGFEWEIAALPTGRQRFLRVSRETGKSSCFT